MMMRKERSRIEAICLRRELNFIAKLPHCEPLREEIASTMEWCVGDHHDYFSDEGIRQRDVQGNVEALRYLGAPDWLIRLLLKVRVVISWVQRLVQFSPSPRAASVGTRSRSRLRLAQS